MVKFNGVNHLAMVTGDMDTTIRFWRDLLGMRLIAGLGHPGYRHYFFEISEHDTIAFFEWPWVEPAHEKDHGAPVRGAFVFDHVSFGVETEEDLWELKDKLDAAGFWVSEVVDHGFIHSIYSFDPNNIPIEFSVNVRGKEIREQPVMADTNPSEITREGSEPQFEKWPPVESPTTAGRASYLSRRGERTFSWIEEGQVETSSNSPGGSIPIECFPSSVGGFPTQRSSRYEPAGFLTSYVRDRCYETHVTQYHRSGTWSFQWGPCVVISNVCAAGYSLDCCRM